VLAHREPLFRRPNQRELSERRTHSGSPQPLAAPGVYARHNSVDTPGLLPDGSPATVSVPASLGEVTGRGVVPLTAGSAGTGAGGGRDELGSAGGDVS